jgi:hypothetical protein
MFHEPQTRDPMTVQKMKVIYMCTLILSNPFHLTIELRLILTQSDL